MSVYPLCISKTPQDEESRDPFKSIKVGLARCITRSHATCHTDAAMPS